MSLLSQGRVEKYGDVISERKDGIWVVLISHVDPDSVGAAVSKREILRHQGCRQVEIVYCGKVDHPQNMEIFNRFNLKELFIEATNFVWNGNENVVLVDSSSTKDNRLADCFFRAIDPCIVIDHHSGNDLPSEGLDHFFWIEGIMGATCTMMYELGTALGVEFSFEARCLLALGIYIDTKKFKKNVSIRDSKAHGALLASGEVTKAYYSLVNYKYPKSLRNMYRKVAKSAKEKEGVFVGSAGAIAEETSGFVSVIADEIISHREEGTVFVCGVFNGKIRIAARSKRAGDLDFLLKQKFGKKGGGARYLDDEEWEGGVLIRIPEFPNFVPDKKENSEAEIPLELIQQWLEKKFFSK